MLMSREEMMEDKKIMADKETSSTSKVLKRVKDGEGSQR